MKHKHAELIKAWADGAEIEYRFIFSPEQPVWSVWKTKINDGWSDSDKYEYRIKPEPKPDVIIEMHMTRFNSTKLYVEPNLRLTFDSETGDLKSAEVI